LMPPLCTAGFGLATGNMPYFLGATYLFFINSVFISLSALLVIRYLKFPIVSYVDMKMRRRVRFGIVAFTLLVSVPSVIIYSKALKQSLYEFRANKFVDEVINTSNRQADHIKVNYSDTSRLISVWVYGDEFSKQEEDSLQLILPNHGLNLTSLEIKNMGNYEEYKKMFERKENEITQKTNDADILREELSSIRSELEIKEKQLWVPERLAVQVQPLNKEGKILFNGLDTIECMVPIYGSDSASRETPVFMIRWNTFNTRSQKIEAKRMNEWLSARFTQQFDSIRVLHLPRLQ
jgi:Domain of unknown function (DUF389)